MPKISPDSTLAERLLRKILRILACALHIDFAKKNFNSRPAPTRYVGFHMRGKF